MAFKPGSSALNPINIALYIAFAILSITILYAAFSKSGDIRSKAADNCIKWEQRSRTVKAKTVRTKGKKGWQTIPEHKEYYYACVKRSGLCEAGSDGCNAPKPNPTKYLAPQN